MRVAVAAGGPDLESSVDPRFARCMYYVFVEPDSMQFETVENPNRLVAGGAAELSARLVAERHAEVLVTGNCGPNAFRTLSLAGIKVIAGVQGSVREAVMRVKTGELRPAQGPTVAPGFVQGCGRRGFGAGGPRRHGARAGLPPWGPSGNMAMRMHTLSSGEEAQQPGVTAPRGGRRDEEVRILRKNEEMLERELREINRRLKRLEGEK